jgi:hypothetical protein
MEVKEIFDKVVMLWNSSLEEQELLIKLKEEVPIYDLKYLPYFACRENSFNDNISLKKVEYRINEEIYFLENNVGYKYKCKFAKKENIWYFVYIKYACPVCFGEVSFEDESCSSCGGEGWGDIAVI